MEALREIEATTHNDDELVAEVLSDCFDSFEEIIKRYEQKVYSTALYLTHNSKAAEDILLEVFSSLHTEFQNDSSKTVLFDWIAQRTLDLSVEKLIYRNRNHSRIEREEETDLDLEEFTATLPTISCAVRESLKLLNFRQRAVFVLRDIQGMPLETIAGLLCSNIFEVRQQLADARKTLRETLSAGVC